VANFEPNRVHLQALTTFARDLERAAKAVSDFANHPLAEIRTTNWSPVWAGQVVQTCEELARAIPNFKSLVTTFGARLGAEHLSDHQNIFQAFVRLEGLLGREGIGKARFFIGADEETVRLAADKLLSAQESRVKLQKSCSGAYRPSLFAVDLQDLSRQWNEAKQAFFLVRYFKKLKVRKQLKLHTDGRIPGDISNDLVLLTQIDSLQKEASGSESLQPLFGAHWLGIETETGEVKKWIILADDLAGQIEGMANGAGAKSTRDKVRKFLDEQFDSSKVNLPPVVSCQSLQAAWGQVEMFLTKIHQLSGHPFLLMATN
jgi:hypothetical protein